MANWKSNCLLFLLIVPTDFEKDYLLSMSLNNACRAHCLMTIDVDFSWEGFLFRNITEILRLYGTLFTECHWVSLRVSLDSNVTKAAMHYLYAYDSRVSTSVWSLHLTHTVPFETKFGLLFVFIHKMVKTLLIFSHTTSRPKSKL